MNKIERFEDIVAWQRARVLTKEVYTLTRTGQFAKDYGLRDQIQRASVSAMANIAEGYERGGDKEFLQFLSNAKGSCGEVKSHLYAAFDQGYVSAPDFEGLYAKADELGRLVGGFMAYLKQAHIGGHKFKGRT